MHDRLSATSAIPIQLPLGQEGDHVGVIDLVEMKAYRYLDETLGAKYEVEEIPAELKEDAQKAHDLMIEKVAEAAHEAGDDVLFEKYVAGEKPTVAEIKTAIRTATIKMTLFPVICGSAFKNKGVQPMLDAVVDYLPTPARRAADGGQRPAVGRAGRRASPRTTRPSAPSSSRS